MRHHFSTKKKRSFEKTIRNSNFALLSFHYCIVQQASSTAKATLTARLMSVNSCTFFLYVSTGKASNTYLCCRLPNTQGWSLSFWVVCSLSFFSNSSSFTPQSAALGHRVHSPIQSCSASFRVTGPIF